MLGDWIYQPNLWHINRFSASMAFFVGVFVAFLPVPGQMLGSRRTGGATALQSADVRGTVWITNPVTMPAVFYLSYRVGALLIDAPVHVLEFELSLTWITDRIEMIWKPLLVGSLLCGLLFGSLGYTAVNLLWRWRVAHHWRKRRARRQTRALTVKPAPDAESAPVQGVQRAAPDTERPTRKA